MAAGLEGRTGLLRRFEVAFQFFTVLPLFPARRFAPEEMARSLGAFPLVGLCLGFALLIVHWTVGWRLPGLLEGTVLSALLAAATGAMHLDGVADTADGLAGGWTRERALEIMKDSRTGAVGATALCLTLLAKAAALGSLPPDWAGRALFATPAAARGAVVWLAFRSRYARPAGGLGAPHTEHLDRETLQLALVSSALPCLLLGWKGLAAFGAVLAWNHGLKGFFHRRLGGITGDVMGFAEETGEVLFLLALHVLG